MTQRARANLLATMTTAEFDRLLAVVIDWNHKEASDVLTVPGVYQIVAEHYNNDVLDRFVEEHTDD